MGLLLAGGVFGVSALSAGALDHAFSSYHCLIDVQLARGVSASFPQRRHVLWFSREIISH